MHFYVAQTARNNCTRLSLCLQGLNTGALLLSTYVAAKVMKHVMYPDNANKDKERKRLASALGIRMQLTVHEAQLASQITFPHDIDVEVKDVAGLDGIVKDLLSDARYQNEFAGAGTSTMLSGSRGLLLYGPPGTGKTMTAKVRKHELAVNHDLHGPYGYWNCAIGRPGMHAAL